jgi:thioredoxin 1
LAAEYGDQVKIVKMDIDAHPNTPGKYGVRAIPTVLAFKGGQVVDQLQGARPKSDFEEMVKKLV